MLRSISMEDWLSLIDQAAIHSVLNVIVPHLDHSGVPPSVRDSMLRQSAVMLALQEPLILAFETTVAAFGKEGVRVCALKGPALSARLYGDPAMRSSIDLDFLVAPEDLEPAVSLMTRLGFGGKSKATVAYLLRHSHHLYFSRPGSTSIEVHFQAYAGFGVTLSSAALMDRAVPYRFSEKATVLVPSPEDEFIYLAVHAAGHSFARLLWLYDMKILIQKNPRLDWDQIVSRSRAAKVSTAVGFAVKVLMDWLNVPLADVAERFAPGGLRRSAAGVILPFASRPSTASTLDNLKGLVFTSMLCDRRSATLWLLQHHIGRSLRRRVHRAAPNLLPESWSG
jgi:hypothetical protein